jgi:hypothetical protein
VWGKRVADGRELARIFGLLRNSTIFAAQKLGLGQCSQKAPEEAGKLKRRPDCQQPFSPTPAKLFSPHIFM